MQQPSVVANGLSDLSDANSTVRSRDSGGGGDTCGGGSTHVQNGGSTDGGTSTNGRTNDVNDDNKNGLTNATDVNGASNVDTLISAVVPVGNFNRSDKEIIRLIGQHLKSVGLHRSAELLMKESNCRLDHPTAAKFRQHVMEADWAKADKDLDELKSLINVASDRFTEMKFLLLEQKYLEHLEDGDVLDALNVLRCQLTPLEHDTVRVHQLSSYMMCSTVEELKARTNWEGKGIKSRTTLMDKLQAYLPPSVMLPPQRLRTLLGQSIDYQTDLCILHNTNVDPSLETASLLADHQCSNDQFPSHLIQVLNDHCDEIWFCKFSPDGTKLATGSKDTNVCIWKVHPDLCRVQLVKTLEGHSCSTSFLAWHPDSVHLMVCGPEESSDVYLWNTDTAKLLKMTPAGEDTLSTCSWNKEGTKFVAGGIKGHFYQCDMDGVVLDSWEGVRVHALWYRANSKHILASDSHHRVRSYNFDDLSDQTLITEEHDVMSFSVHDNDRLALLNVATQGLHLWDLEDKCLVRRYQGVVQGHFTLYSCFGGVNQNFIASGSEDTRVYIYHIKRETPVAILNGHTRTVNCVSWNPVYPHMLASVSDDCTLRIWGPKQYMPKVYRNLYWCWASTRHKVRIRRLQIRKECASGHQPHHHH